VPTDTPAKAAKASNHLTLRQTFQPPTNGQALVVPGNFGTRFGTGGARLAATGGTPRGDECTAFHVFSALLLVLRRDRADWLGRRHPPTDQKVGGSNPSERARKVQFRGFFSAYGGCPAAGCEDLLRTKASSRGCWGAHKTRRRVSRRQGRLVPQGHATTDLLTGRRGQVTRRPFPAAAEASARAPGGDRPGYLDTGAR
jgi:hypothetical protein